MVGLWWRCRSRRLLLFKFKVRWLSCCVGRRRGSVAQFVPFLLNCIDELILETKKSSKKHTHYSPVTVPYKLPPIPASSRSRQQHTVESSSITTSHQHQTALQHNDVLQRRRLNTPFCGKNTPHQLRRPPQHQALSPHQTHHGHTSDATTTRTQTTRHEFCDICNNDTYTV